MADSGAGFGADLYRLETVAKDHLPTVSMIYDTVIGKVRASEVGLNAIPAVPEQFQGAGESVLSGYGELSGAVVDVLMSTWTSLEETAESLHEATMRYAETNQAAANEFRKMLDERGKPRPEPTP